MLVSGGADSAVLVADALGRSSSVTPLYIRSGLSWERAELHWLRRYLRSLAQPKLKPLRVLSFNARDLYGRHWSITRKRVPGGRTADAAVYLPGRNVVLLSKAAIFAALGGISDIEIGILGSNPFGDSSAGFLRAFSKVLTQALSRPVRIRAPFGRLTKRQVLERGRGLRLELSFSCIRPQGLKPCGRCNKCYERKKAGLA